MSEQSPIFCDRCLTILTPGEGNFFVVAIEAVADPTPPQFDHDDLDSGRDLQQEMRDLIRQLEGMSERELVDQVHRRVVIHLCQNCFREWIENPAGR